MPSAVLKVGYLSKFIIDIPDAAGYAVFSENAARGTSGVSCGPLAACSAFRRRFRVFCASSYHSRPAHRAGRFFAALRAPCPGLDVRAGMW